MSEKNVFDVIESLIVGVVIVTILFFLQRCDVRKECLYQTKSPECLQ